MALTAPPKDLLLLIYVHGFKGNDVTFESFPERVAHLLKATHPSLRVESRVFPAYQTRGELKAATLAFVDWLTTLVVMLENDHGAGGGAGKAKIVLMGHSMGGLLIADAALDIANTTREDDPMWPKIVGIMAFDTPYIGLHPHTFKHHLTQAAGHVETARNVASGLTMLSPMLMGFGFGQGNKNKEASSPAGPSASSSSPSPRSSSSFKGKSREADTVPPSSSTSDSTAATKSFWSVPAMAVPSTKTLYGLGALALGAAAAGTAYYRRDDFVNGWKWGYEHMTFVRNLWDENQMKERLVLVEELAAKRNVRFWNFYTYLPPSPPKNLVGRTFSLLPTTTHPLYPNFKSAPNTIATDEVSAHMGMFNPKTNDGFYDLGLEVVNGIGERIEEEGVDRCSTVELDEKMGQEVQQWKEEKDAKGNTVWVEI
ncbi:hypothetical protein P7C73_g3373, partial [Tremellales sp. Uapishka_1]